jgi:hypothetical protein
MDWKGRGRQRLQCNLRYRPGNLVGGTVKNHENQRPIKLIDVLICFILIKTYNAFEDILVVLNGIVVLCDALFTCCLYHSCSLTWL